MEHISKQHIRRPYEYFAKDHLGNVRVVFSPNGRSAMRVQEEHYYPFGMPMAYTHYASSTSTPNRLLYNSKELLNYLPGLRWYDYGARMYDAQVGRWHSVDRFAEKYAYMTPYQYGANNPIKFIDIKGDSVYIAGEQTKQFTRELDKSSSLKIKYDKKTGSLTAKGEAKTEYDKILLEAINSNNINVHIITTKENKTPDGKSFAIGAFGGNKTKNGKVETTQIVNMNHAKKAEGLYGVSAGIFAGHEIIESYIGGKETPNTPAPTFNPNSPGYNNYLNAHNKANQIDPRHANANVSISVDPVTGTYYLDKYLEFGGQKILIQSVPLK